MSQTEITIIAGLFFSDEGKGRVVNDIIEQNKNQYDIVMRVNGSWSSNHQIDKGYHIKCNHLPSTLDKNITLIIGAGMCVKPNVLLEEIQQQERQNQKIYVSEDCPVIDANETVVNNELGTTGSGIRKTYIDRLNHVGKVLKDVVELYPELKKYLINDDKYFELTANKKIIVEGSHGYLIDKDFGEYPYTTSANTTPSMIMGLTKYDSSVHKRTIFVSGLMTISAGKHPIQKTFEQYNLKHLIDIIPENIKYDKSCNHDRIRNFGAFDFDLANKILRFYPSCGVIFNFFDLIQKMGKFYYIENEQIYNIEIIDKKTLAKFISTKLNRNIFLNDSPFA
ncbi:adenylosuccinate synthetase [Bodo saltans virus]|uniref:Adenylosuccinate synthetase n=1 Tax=Bodo saltans virus TaxID=2024608 RepID=A0A2H4UVL4_9VIRU|nr:adenylosuccinate synthetase [Bodo saltans virus]ATZ80962.1 adenylosuccinate synthetase [Bodo saltans virus]